MTEQPLYYGNVTRAEFNDGRRHADALTRECLRGKPCWIDRDALSSAAYLGLLKAARKYDPAVGTWRGMVYVYVRGCLSEELEAQSNWLRCRKPRAELTFAERAEIAPQSLDARLSEDDRVIDLVGGNEFEDGLIDHLGLEAALAHLKPEYRDLLWQRANGITQHALAALYGISEATVYWREKQALRQARAIVAGWK